MSKLLPCLAFSAADAMAAERLLDLLAIYRNKQSVGEILLAAAPDTHQETRAKIRIAAEIGFASVDLLEIGWPAVAPTTKAESVNRLWFEAATHATRCYQWPMLWLEPDSIALKPSWLEELTHAYFNQGKRYFGSIRSSNDGKIKCLSRVAVYPRGAAGELKEFTAGKIPFEVASGGVVVPRAGKSKLFQQTPFTSTTDRAVIRPEAVLIHHDKESVLLSALIDEYSRPPVQTTPANAIKEHPGTANGAVTVTIEGDPEPVDKRTKAHKEWKQRHQPVSA